MTHKFQACIALMLLLRYPLKHRRKFACRIIKLIYLQNIYFVKMCLKELESIPFAHMPCHFALVKQNKLRQNDWAAENLTNNI